LGRENLRFKIPEHFLIFKKMGTTKFDIAEYLDSKEMIAEYLNTVLEEGDSANFIVATGHIAKAIGIFGK